MEENTKSFQQKLDENQQQQHIQEEEDNETSEMRKLPHIMNLNEDPLLNGKIIYSLQK